MVLTLTNTRAPATDVSWLVHKHPDRVRSFGLAFGTAHVVWPEVGDDRTTMALIVDVDPVSLVRGRPGSHTEGTLDAYVNDRPYVASSFMAVALAQVFRSAMNGSCNERPGLADEPLPLEVRLDVVAARGGEHLLTTLFGPLGYDVEATRLPRDETVPAWGDSALYRLVLRHVIPLQVLFRHLYVLLPVLDDEKHYWVGDAEVEKLLAKGEGWLAEHPAKEQIAARYLKHRRSLERLALSRLVGPEAGDAEDDADGIAPSAAEGVLEKPLQLGQLRLDRVVKIIAASGARSVVDLGCGEGKLLRRLLGVAAIERVVGVDVSARSLEIAERRLDHARTPLSWQSRLTLLHGSVTWRDPRLDGFDAAAAVEVIEHLDPSRLDAFAASVLGASRPRLLVLTTPNAEYNELFTSMAPGSFRHADHRFEWTRRELETWATAAADRYRYDVVFEQVGASDPRLGSPTSVAVFRCR